MIIRILALLLLSLLCTCVRAQKDSLPVRQSVWVNFSGDIQIRDARSYETRELGYKRSKGRQTWVANVVHKSNPFLSGTQFGLAYFRSWRGGYFNLSAYGSGSNNFPQLVAVAEGYFNLPRKFEARAGIRHNQAAVPFSIVSLGLNRYFGPFYAGYTFHWVTNESTYHTGFLRMYPERTIHMLEIAFGSAALEELITRQIYLDQRVQLGAVVRLNNNLDIKLQAGVSITQAEIENARRFIYQLGATKSF